jgi:hypothetical protein
MRFFPPSRFVGANVPKARRANLCLEPLEDRRVPATLYVVPHGSPTDTLHFRTLDEAVAAANIADTVQIEPGADAPRFDSAVLAAPAELGATQVTSNGLIAPGQVVLIGGNDRALVDRTVPAADLTFTLMLHTPLANAHAAGDAVEATQTIGIGKPAVSIRGDPLAEPVAVPNLEVQSVAVHLQHLRAQAVTLDVFTTIEDSDIETISGQGDSSYIIGNRLGRITLTNPSAPLLYPDFITDNQITGTLSLTRRIPRITRNTFRVRQDAGYDDAITLLGCGDIDIGNNDITFSANAFNPPENGMAILMQDDGSNISANFHDNNISTEGYGVGLVLNEPPNRLVRTSVEGNDFRANRIGVYVISYGPMGCDLGGFSSRGGNNFRGFSDAPSSLNAGRFAIYLTPVGYDQHVFAQHNLWSVADPNTVVKDEDDNHLTGGGQPGSGNVDVGTTQLDADHQYVQTLYHDFLGRTAPLDNLDAWASLLPSVGRPGVANGIVRSSEAHTWVVDALYRQFLKRPADPAGEANAVGFLQHGGTEEQLIAAFVTSPEYYDHATGGSSSGLPDGNWLALLYQQLLGRPGSDGEISAWLAALPTLGRTAVASAFVSSAEYRTNAVLQFYAGLLHRATPPLEEELLAWVRSPFDLDHGGRVRVE